MQPATLDDIVHLIKVEYAEMPGLKLTLDQAQRLWNLPGDVCEPALTALIAAGVLMRTTDGAYIKRTG